MPFNGAGVYSAPGADFPAVTQTVISSTHYNNVINDIATGLSLCLTKDGQQTATANIPFGGFRATNVGITAIAGSVGTPAINVSDAGTGLYRSAASELAVTVAGTQRARFDGTGLIVTGVGTFSGATSTTTLTASTSVVTPLVGTATAADLVFQTGGAGKWQISNAGTGFYPFADNTQPLGSSALRISAVFTPIIDSGTTGSLSLKTNNGTTQALIVHVASAVNFLALSGAATGAANVLFNGGTDADIALRIATKGAGTLSLQTNDSTTQLQVLHTASATRNITVTGSNGGNPTISTTAGGLAITPAVVMASTLAVTGGITPNFTSAETAIPAAGTITNIAHGLTTVPTLFYVIMRNKTAELGYSIGDEVILYSPAGGAIVADTTNISVNLGANTMLRKDTVVLTAFTAASWKFVARAYK